MAKKSVYFVTVAALAAFTLPALSSAKSYDDGDVTKVAQVQSQGMTSAVDFNRFIPRPGNKSLRMDYSIWDEALNDVILDLGPSTRNRATRPQAQVGTRMVLGHKTPYRLEGTRFTFAYLNDEFKAGLTTYREDLERIASDYDITTFSRAEQLAYWFNLHNVAMIEQIALAYPIDSPKRIKIRVDGKKVPLDDARFLNIQGQKLSLKDIRTEIVYKNWNDPDVIYGFFHGDIGSPALQRYAFTASDTDLMLTQNADDFVNSLRGFNLGSKSRNVSAIYKEAEPYFFKNWDADLQRHLLKHANDDVRQEVLSGKKFAIDRYDSTIGDLSGGRRLASSGLSSTQNGSVPFEVARLLTEVRDKKQYLRRRGLLNTNRGFVIIEDLVPEAEQGSTPNP